MDLALAGPDGALGHGQLRVCGAGRPRAQLGGGHGAHLSLIPAAVHISDPRHSGGVAWKGSAMLLNSYPASSSSSTSSFATYVPALRF